MKKMLAGLIVAAVIGMAAPVMAATPFVSAVNLATGDTYAVSRDYKAEKLLSVEVFQANATTGTVAIARIRDGRTNTVGSITLAASAGIYRTTNTVWLFRGDQLRFTHSAGATSSVVEIVGELSE